MIEPKLPNDLEEVCELLDEMIVIHKNDPREDPPTLRDKLDRLAMLIEILRIFPNTSDEESPSAPVVPVLMAHRTPEGKLCFPPVVDDTNLETTTRPEKLALPLLDFLYRNPSGGKQVLATINSFVRVVSPTLYPKDFARTATGVLRITTNARFAASILRKNGLLQFTSREAFKTWRLSLFGLLAAEEFRYPDSNDESVNDLILRENILRRLQPLLDMEHLLGRLAQLCEQCSLPAHHAEEVAGEAEQSLKEYLEICGSSVGKAAREAACENLLLKINQSDPIVRLIQEFDLRAQNQSSLI